MTSAPPYVHAPVQADPKPEASLLPAPVMPPPALPPSAPVGRREDTISGEGGGGGGGGGGGLLDATRSSAVSNMLYSAKQNQATVSDSSDDDWED